VIGGIAQSKDAEQTRFHYACGALEFDVEYSADGKTATMQPKVLLTAHATESGMALDSIRAV
jgi:hypothetical protein